eukprot:TRINITY_DN4814_c0_g1_i7.p1 TRINITY_DN4814_c0_g1~~TRINITY_DN4814_c0_g1_i7.p1  ORF type:complete len:266 (+),score=37.56 TRINITY_DN4814_c0_g1_i7:38-799(+)
MEKTQDSYYGGIDQEDKSYSSFTRTTWLDSIPGLRSNDARQAFVKKVYCLVFFMLSVPTLLIILAVSVPGIRSFMRTYMVLYYLAAIISVIMLLSLLCFYRILKRVPHNYIFLSVFTVLESYTVATLTCFYEPMSILYAAILTFTMALSLTVYACFTRTDLTSIGSTLCWVSLGVSLGAMILMAIVRSHFVLIICAWIFLIIAALYVIVDTQLIMGGKYKELSLDDYIIGAMMLFIDFVHIFVQLLIIIGRRN